MNQFLSKVVLFAVGVPLVMVMSAKAKEKTVKTYNITEIEAPIMDSCKGGMTVNDVKFKEGASANKGCACIAKYAASEFEPQYHATYSKVLRAKLKYSKLSMNAKTTTDTIKIMTDAVEALEKIEKESGLTSSKLSNITTHMSGAIEICGNSQTHRGESVQSIAALQAKPARVTRTAKAPSSANETTPPLLRK